MKTSAYWRNNNMSFRDASYSSNKGKSLWETCPQLAALDPNVAHIFYDDFYGYLVSSGSDYVGWIMTENGGSGGQGTTDAAGGIFAMYPHTDDDDNVQIQWNSENFALAATKPLWFEARVKLSDAIQSDMVVGLCVTDTSLTTAMSDGVYFRKDDGNTSLDFVTEATSSETETSAVGTMTDDTYVRLGFWYDGTTVRAYVDGVLVASHTTTITAVELAVSFAVQNGEGAAKTMSIDYFKVVQIR